MDMNKSQDPLSLHYIHLTLFLLPFFKQILDWPFSPRPAAPSYHHISNRSHLMPHPWVIWHITCIRILYSNHSSCVVLMSKSSSGGELQFHWRTWAVLVYPSSLSLLIALTSAPSPPKKNLSHFNCLPTTF